MVGVFLIFPPAGSVWQELRTQDPDIVRNLGETDTTQLSAHQPGHATGLIALSVGMRYVTSKIIRMNRPVTQMATGVRKVIRNLTVYS